MTTSIYLPSLTPREGIADAIYRLVNSLDNNDKIMFRSAFKEGDATIQVKSGGEPRNYIVSDFEEQVLNNVGPKVTTHMVSNVRISLVDGATRAFLSASVLAQHCKMGSGLDPDGSKFMIGETYAANLERDIQEDLWKINNLTISLIWSQGDPTVLQ